MKTIVTCSSKPKYWIVLQSYCAHQHSQDDGPLCLVVGSHLHCSCRNKTVGLIPLTCVEFCSCCHVLHRSLRNESSKSLLLVHPFCSFSNVGFLDLLCWFPPQIHWPFSVALWVPRVTPRSASPSSLADFQSVLVLPRRQWGACSAVCCPYFWHIHFATWQP